MFRCVLFVAGVLVLAFGLGYVIATSYHGALDAQRRLDRMEEGR